MVGPHAGTVMNVSVYFADVVEIPGNAVLLDLEFVILVVKHMHLELLLQAF